MAGDNKYLDYSGLSTFWSKIKLYISNLQGTVTGTAGADKTITSYTDKGGKTEVTFGSIQIAESQVTDLTTHLGEKAPLASPALTGTPTAPTAALGTNDTQIATTAFVQSAIEEGLSKSDAMVYKGKLSGAAITSTNKYGAKTPAGGVGDTYKVDTAGYINGVAVEVGDMLICNTDGAPETTADNYAAVAGMWDVIQGNLDGTVIGPSSSTDSHVAVFDGTTGHQVKDSGFTIGKSVPADAVFTDTDTKVTSVANHYSPAEDTSAAISAKDGTAAQLPTSSTGAINVVTGLKRDAAGHVVGVTSSALWSPNTEYTNGKLGQGYGTCSTAAATVNKVVTMSGYELVTGGIVAVRFTNALCAGAKLNINSKGAKDVFIDGAAATAASATSVQAGDLAYFMYDGTQYQFLGSDRVFGESIVGLSVDTTTKPGTKIITYTKADGSTSSIEFVDTDTKYSAGTGLDLTGTTFSNAGVRSITQDKDNGRILSINTGGTTTSITIPDNNTTYSAGTGLNLNGTVFSNAGVTSITQDTTDGHVLNITTNGVSTSITMPDNNTTYEGMTASNYGLGKLGSDTKQTVAAAAVSSTANRTYAIQNNDNGQLVVNVPWTDTTHTNAKLGQGYGTCATAAATATKVVTMSNYVQSTGGIVAVKFTNGLCANAKMNINSTGEKSIYINGAAVTATTAGEVQAGDLAYFIFDGTYYHLLGTDRVFGSAVTGLSISGKTITYTKADGSTGTLTTQDTTYSASNGISLSGTTFSNSGVRSVTQDTTDGHKLTFNVGGTDTVITIPDNDTTYEAMTASKLGLGRLGSDTKQTVAANAVSSTASRTYAIQMNTDNQLVVNVPWENNTYTNASMGQGYATCSTAAATTAKVASLTGYELTTGGIVAVKFTYDMCAAATLNINSKGAKAIFVNGAAVTATTAGAIKANDIAYFMYDGTQYQFLGTDRGNTLPIVSISRSGTTFTATRVDGSTTTFTQQDNNTTYEFADTYNATTNKGATVATVTNAIGALDVDAAGGDGKYIKLISETDGKISATAETMDTAPTSGSNKAVTSGAVYTALSGKQATMTAITDKEIEDLK